MLKVSIIVLIFKVEPYLRKCLDSIVSQTYKNLEIILSVSTNPNDACEQICDEFARLDSRIVLAKSKPAGISAARNLGMSFVSGHYVAFVDGDDWIEIDMIESLMKNSTEHNAQIAICGKYEEHLGYSRQSRSIGIQTMSTMEAFERLLYMEDYGMHIWDKLFSVSVIKGISFPQTKEAEDRYWIYQVMTNAHTLVYDPIPKYHFRVRRNSCSNNIINASISLDADEKMCDYVTGKYENLRAAAASFLFTSNYAVVYSNIQNRFWDAELPKDLFRNMKKSAGQILHDRKAAKAMLFKALLVIMSKQAFLAFVKWRTHKYRDIKSNYFD